MATSFTGWLDSWGGSWGPVAFDPNAMAGAAGFSLTAIASLTVGASNELSGVAGMTFSAVGVLGGYIVGVRLIGPNAYPPRAPKSTNRLRLQRISEGRAAALSARAATYVRAVRASGAVVLPVPVQRPGSATCVSCRSKSMARVSRARGGAQARPLRGHSPARAGTAAAVGAAAGTLFPGFAVSMARTSTGSGAAVARAGGFMSVSGHGYAVARGGRNLSDAVLAAVVRATIDTRR